MTASRHDGAVSTSWSAPDPRGTAAVPAFGLPQEQAAQDIAGIAELAWAGGITAVVTVLVGAPLGLLWSAAAPRVDVIVTGDRVDLAESGSGAFIAADGFFLLAVTLAGVVGGLVAWRLARGRGPGIGPGVVAGLALGGIAAAYVAMVVGQQIGADQVDAAVAGTRQGALELPLRLRAREALVGWPVGALVAYVVATLVPRRAR